MDLFTEVELLIMGSVLGFLILIVLILVISELVCLKKNKQKENILLEIETEEINLDNNSLLENNTIPSKELEKLEEIVKPQEELIIEDLDPVVIKIEAETNSLLDSKQKAQIELLKVEEELETNYSLEDTITNLEKVEEENAIISYQELLSNTKELEVVNCDSGDEPITISEVFKMFNENNNQVQIPEDSVFNYDNLLPSKIDNESLTEIQLENTANLEKLEKEIRKTNEFLNILNELKKNLE